MYKNIVFDVDGTLVDSTHCAKAAYRQVILEELGKTVSAGELAHGMRYPTLKALEVFGFTDIPDALAKYHSKVLQAFTQVNIYSGVEETLASIKQKNAILGIATARNKRELDGDVTFARIASRFDCIVCADDTERYKPDPDPLLLFFKQANARPQETLYIGDTKNDFLCAKSAGVHFALALWGAETREGIDAQYFLTRPQQIIELLDECRTVP